MWASKEGGHSCGALGCNVPAAWTVYLSMRPNIDDDLLFKCACADDHFLEVHSFEGEPWLWFHVLQEKMGLWGILSHWRKHRSLVFADIGLTRSDVVALRQRLDEWLDAKGSDSHIVPFQF